MKKHVLIISILALICYSCSNEEASNDLNSSVDRRAAMSTFLKSDQFKDYLSSRNKQSNAQSKIAGKNSDKGLMIIDDGYNVLFSAFNWETSEMVFIGGEGTIEELPNGRGKFSVHTNNPSASYSSYSSDIYLGSDCVDGPLGTFNFNVICNYTVETLDFGGGFVLTFYNMLDDNSSATSGNGHCKISDAEPIIDWDTFEQIGCGEATIYKTVKIKGNDTKGFKISVE